MATVASAKNLSIGPSSHACSFQMLVPYFESGLNFILEKIAAKAFGSIFEKYTALDKTFSGISVRNVTAFEKELQLLICGTDDGFDKDVVSALIKHGLDLGGLILNEKTEGGLYGSDVATRNAHFKKELGEILRTMRFGTNPRAQPELVPLDELEKRLPHLNTDTVVDFVQDLTNLLNEFISLAVHPDDKEIELGLKGLSRTLAAPGQTRDQQIVKSRTVFATLKTLVPCFSPQTDRARLADLTRPKSAVVHSVKRVAREVTQSSLMRTGVATMAGGLTTALVATGSALASSDGFGFGLVTASLLAGTAAGGAIKSATEWLFGANVPPPSHAPEFQTPQERVTNVSAAFLRLRDCILKLDESDRNNLSWQPLNDDPQVIGMKLVAKHELRAQIFNLATLGLITTVAFGVLGIISIKTLLVGVAFYYTLRRVADLSLALSNIETRTIPMIPYVKVPTLQGVGQIVKRSLTYVAAYVANYGGIRVFDKSFEKLDPSSIGFNADGAKMAGGAAAVAGLAVFVITPLGFILSGIAAAAVGTTTAVAMLTPEGRKKFWEHVAIISPSGNDWTPNLLTVGNVVILKNSCVSWKYVINLGLEMGLIYAGLKTVPAPQPAAPVAPAGRPPQAANPPGLRRRTVRH